MLGCLIKYILFCKLQKLKCKTTFTQILVTLNATFHYPMPAVADASDRAISCICDFICLCVLAYVRPCSKRKMVWATNTKLGTHSEWQLLGMRWLWGQKVKGQGHLFCQHGIAGRYSHLGLLVIPPPTVVAGGIIFYPWSFFLFFFFFFRRRISEMALPTGNLSSSDGRI